jgi:muramidase (phage lysozyme)
MADLKLKALVNTVLKRLTIDSSGLPDSEKLSLSAGTEIGINWFRSAANNHWEVELKSPKIGFFNWFAFKDHVELLGIPSEPSMSTQRQAFLDMIAFAEGTDKNVGDGSRTGYDIIFTFDRFTDFSDHPRRIRCSGSLCSDAAGRYQFLSTTWDFCQQSLNLPDFSPASQERAAVFLIKNRGSLDDVEEGDIDKACFDPSTGNGVSFEWASLPPGQFGQPVITLSEAENTFVKAGGVLK